MDQVVQVALGFLELRILGPLAQITRDDDKVGQRQLREEVFAKTVQYACVVVAEMQIRQVSDYAAACHRMFSPNLGSPLSPRPPAPRRADLGGGRACRVQIVDLVDYCNPNPSSRQAGPS